MPTILNFIAKQPAAKMPLLTWCQEVRKASWVQSADIKGNGWVRAADGGV